MRQFYLFEGPRSFDSIAVSIGQRMSDGEPTFVGQLFDLREEGSNLVVSRGGRRIAHTQSGISSITTFKGNAKESPVRRHFNGYMVAPTELVTYKTNSGSVLTFVPFGACLQIV